MGVFFVEGSRFRNVRVGLLRWSALWARINGADVPFMRRLAWPRKSEVTPERLIEKEMSPWLGPFLENAFKSRVQKAKRRQTLAVRFLRFPKLAKCLLVTLV